MNLTSSTYNSRLFQPGLEWSCIVVFIVFTVVLVMTGSGQLLNLAFPALAVVLGTLLYSRQKILYNGFIWWLWFLSPFVRRASDYYGSYTEPSPILLTPSLVVLISVLTTAGTLFRSRLKSENLFYFLAISGLIYGFLIGLVNHSFLAVSIKAFDYFVPVVYSYYIFSNWKKYPQLKQNTLRVFLWGVLVMGAYGIFQFVSVPVWDAHWLLKSGFGSGGQPVPFRLNIWSTMQSNRPFGTVMGAGLVLLLINRNAAAPGILANVLGYISFLLARKRTTWLSWLISIIVLGKSLKFPRQIRLIVTLVVFSSLLFFIISLSPLSESLSERFSTFSNLEEDRSAEVRQESFEKMIGPALTNVTGVGLGGTSFDSGIISLLFDLGWIGLIPYLWGIIFLFLEVFKSPLIADDNFALAARAIALSTLSQLPLGRPYESIQGVVLWGFLGLSLAAIRHADFCKRQAALVERRSAQLFSFRPRNTV